MTREETFNIICTILETYAGEDLLSGQVETMGEAIMDAMEVMGADLLDHLDPPAGLKHWLESHGLSLVVTSEITPPQVWEAIQGEAVEPVEEKLEIEPAPVLQVGDYVEYRTATIGPRGQSTIGSGRVKAVTSDGLVIVQVSFAQDQWLNPREGDSIRVITSPPGP